MANSPSCLKCYKEEAAGHPSKRSNGKLGIGVSVLILNKILEETNEDGSVPNLAYIDLRSRTNVSTCMCDVSSTTASGWIKDYKAIFPVVKNEFKRDYAMER